MQNMKLEGRWIVVTGASAGLGREMSIVLARDWGANVIPVARRADRLEALATEIREKHGRECLPIGADLASAHGPERVFEGATDGRDVYGAILNAGVTFSGHAIEQDHDDFERMLATNVSSQVSLSKRFGRYFADRGDGGGIMLVSSLTSMAPFPYQAAYAGTKAFLTTYGRSLAHELRARNVSLTVFMPGGIATDMLDVSGMGKWKKGDVGVMDVEVCAREAVRGFVKRKGFHVPGFVNQLSAIALKLAPHAIAVKVIAKIYNDGVSMAAPAPAPAPAPAVSDKSPAESRKDLS